MPQLDVHTFAPQIVWLAISFIVLYLLMARVGLPQVGGILERRRQRLDGDLAKAAQMKDEAAAVIASYERALATARADAQAMVRETTERLNAVAATRQHELAQALASETARAEERIAAAKQQALAGLRDVAVEVAEALALKVTGVALDPARAGAAVDAVLRERA
jgi:F-type H+-transporting ATPase subunit b